jgi:hypothetical protein
MATCVALMAAGLLAAGLTACDGGVPGSERERTIPRETFIRAMVELRLLAAESPEEGVATTRRDGLLGELGVTSEQLIRFAEVHGRNVPYMNDVWNEVHRQLLDHANEEEDETPALPIRPPATGPGS